jgi:IclR family acetate operon transcriptional repressor
MREQGDRDVRGAVRTVDRTCAVVDLIAAAGGELSLTEIAKGSGLAPPTVHRILQSLATRGWLRQLPSRRYELGASLLWLGEHAHQRLAAWARPHLAALAEECGESASLARLDDNKALYLAQVASEHAMRTVVTVGSYMPLHCTAVGKALLTQLDAELRRAFLGRIQLTRHTAYTIVDPDALLAEIESVGTRGYAADDQEHEIGETCVAVPVPGTPWTSALSVSGPRTRITDDVNARLAEMLRRTAAELAESFEPPAP